MSGRVKTELERNEMEKNINGQKAKDARCMEMNKMCQRADRMSMDRRSYLLSEEENTFNNFQKAEKEQARKCVDLEQEQKLAQAINDLKHQELVDLKNNQFYQTNSHDVRRTEKQLQNDLVKNELIFQIKEKIAKQKEEKVLKYNTDLKIIEADHEEKQKDIDLQCKKKQSKSDYNKAITDQIRDTADMRQALQSKYSQPIGNLSESKECFKKKLQNENIGLKNKKEAMENERMKSDKLNSQIEEYLTFVDKRKKQQEELKNKKKEEKERIYKHLVENMVSLDTTKSSEQRVMYEQEKLNSAQLAMENVQKESKKLQRGEILKQNELQLQVKKDREKGYKEHDSVESKKLLQKIQDFNKVEETKTIEKRQKMMEYGNELRKAIDKRADLRNEQKTQLKNDENMSKTFFSY